MNYVDLALQQKADLILQYLKEDSPAVTSPLLHRNVFEFLISVMLSPQTNDEITNKVTPGLFDKYPTPELLAEADPEDVMKLIKTINYYKTKTVRIISASKMLLEEFGGKVPHSMDEMLRLPGVGRKVANVIIDDWYATSESENPPSVSSTDPNRYNSADRGSIQPSGFVVDTHVLRVSQALRLTEHTTPEKIEKDMVKLFPSEEWMGTSLRMIYHGREVFQAKNPSFRSFPKWKELYESLGY